MHSCTKYLGGHCDIIMGSLATDSDVIFEKLKTVQRYRGAVPSPFECYLMTRSLKTLKVKIQSRWDLTFIVETYDPLTYNT